MLANRFSRPPSFGRASPGYPQRHSLHVIIGFVRSELPRWSEDPERPSEQAEDRLTFQLCAHLNDAAHSAGLDWFRFAREWPDQHNRTRALDIGVTPAHGHIVQVEGRKYAKYEALLPIECKRLPTPPGATRDRREYLFSEQHSAGGVQRFKEGDHARGHTIAAMIGYLQDGDARTWIERINAWISELNWAGEQLEIVDSAAGVAFYATSLHVRSVAVEAPIELHHLWVEL